MKASHHFFCSLASFLFSNRSFGAYGPEYFCILIIDQYSSFSKHLLRNYFFDTTKDIFSLGMGLSVIPFPNNPMTDGVSTLFLPLYFSLFCCLFLPLIRVDALTYKQAMMMFGTIYSLDHPYYILNNKLWYNSNATLYVNCFSFLLHMFCFVLYYFI